MPKKICKILNEASCTELYEAFFSKAGDKHCWFISNKLNDSCLQFHASILEIKQKSSYHCVMDPIFAVIEICLPVFLLTLVGLCWAKAGQAYNVEFITKLVMDLAIPCLIFISLMQTNINSSTLSTLFFATISVLAMITVTMFFAVKSLKLNFKTFFAPLIFGNSANLGIPICLFAFGKSGFEHAIFIFSIMAVYSMTFGVWVISGGGCLIKLFKEPLVISVFLGMTFLFFGWETPDFVTDTINLLGQIAIPLMLLTLGVTVGKLGSFKLIPLIFPSTLKFVICLACGLLAATAFDLEKLPAAALIIQVTMPVAVSSYMLAEKYNADAETVAALVIVSTIIAIFYIPATLFVIFTFF